MMATQLTEQDWDSLRKLATAAQAKTPRPFVPYEIAEKLSSRMTGYLCMPDYGKVFITPKGMQALREHDAQNNA
jgi:hypothetical protein